MCQAKTTPQSGFSLLEMLISMTLLVVFMMGLIMILESNQATYLRGERATEVHQVARLAIGEVTRQLRTTGYFPENFTAPPASPLLDNPIHVATDTAFAVYGDLDGAGSSSVYLYCWDGAAVRRVVSAPGVATAYTCGNGDLLADEVTEFGFIYLDTDQNAIADPTAPFQLDGQATAAVPAFDDTSERSLVRRVVVHLTVAEEVPRQGLKTYRLSTDITLRNVR